MAAVHLIHSQCTNSYRKYGFVSKLIQSTDLGFSALSPYFFFQFYLSEMIMLCDINVLLFNELQCFISVSILIDSLPSVIFHVLFSMRANHNDFIILKCLNRFPNSNPKSI